MSGRRRSLMDYFRSGPAGEDSASGSPKLSSGTNGTSNKRRVEEDGRELMEVFENERYRDQIGWSAKNLELDDPKNFSWAGGGADTFISPPLPSGYEYLGIWELDKSVPRSQDGWLYARSFKLLECGIEVSTDSSTAQNRTRRRRWTRDMKRREDAPPAEIASANDSDEEGTISTESERVAEKYLFLKFGSGGAIASSGGGSNTPGGGGRFDEDDTRSSNTGGEVGTNAAIKYIGRQIRELESECERETANATAEWKKRLYPQYKSQAREIEKAVERLRTQIKTESNVSEEHTMSLEEVLNAHIDVLNATKKRMYFPDSNLSTGSNDAFFAIDDFWLENISGVFVVDLIGSLTTPQCILTLTGTTDGPNSGVVVKLKLEGFKLRAKGAPNISVDEAVLTACVRVSLMLSFITGTNKWQLLPSDFSLDLITFSGPYGLSRAFVSTILAMVSSKIREAILMALPMEIGNLLRTLPIPFSIRGEFDINGTPLDHLSTPLSESQDLCRSLGFNPDHMQLFMSLQKLLGRHKSGKLLRTMQDMINYRTVGAKHSRLWEAMSKLWNQAASILIEMRVEAVATAAFAEPIGPAGSAAKGLGVSSLGHNSLEVTTLATFSFDDIIQAVEDVMRKPLSNISGQFSVNQIVNSLRNLAHRLALVSASAEKKSPTDELFMDARIKVLLKRATKEFDEAKEVLRILSKNFDYGQVLADVRIKSGAAGSISVRATQIVGKAPISIWLNLPQRLIYLGINCPVPYVIALKTDPEGNFVVEFNHCGSVESSKRGIFMKYEDLKDIHQNKMRKKNRKKKNNWRGQWASKLSKTRLEEIEKSNKNHLSPLLSMMESYEITASPLVPENSGHGLFSKPQIVLATEKLGGKLHSSFSRMTSKVAKALPIPHHHKRGSTAEEIVTDKIHEAPAASTEKSIGVTAQPSGFDSSYTHEESSLSEQVFCADEAAAVLSVAKQFSQSSIAASADLSMPLIEDETSASNNDVPLTEDYQPPRIKTNIPILRSYRRKARLEQTLNACPKGKEIVEVGSAVIYKPRLTIVTERAMSLPAGAELVTVSLGQTSAAGLEDSQVRIENVIRSVTEDEFSAIQLNRELEPSISGQDRLSISSESVASVADSETNYSESIAGASVSESLEKSDFKNKAYDDRLNEIGQVDGSPVVVQTGNGIKVLAEVPKVDIRLNIADLLRFVNTFLASSELLSYLGAQDEDEYQDFDEMIAFSKAVLARAGKYFLLPGLVCELYILGKVVVVDGEIVVKIETPADSPSETPATDVSKKKTEIVDSFSRQKVPLNTDQIGAASDVLPFNRSPKLDLGKKNSARNVIGTPQKSTFPHEDDEEDFWANHKSDSNQTMIGNTRESPPNNECIPNKSTTLHRDSVHAAYVQMSMNMMDLIEDHKVLTSLGQDLILALLHRESKKITRVKKK